MIYYIHTSNNPIKSFETKYINQLNLLIYHIDISDNPIKSPELRFLKNYCLFLDGERLQIENKASSTNWVGKAKVRMAWMIR